MRVRRNHEESDIISKIYVFAERCSSFDKERLSPMLDDFGRADDQNLLAPEFIAMMQKIVPFVRETRREDLSMRIISEVAGVDIVKLYETISENIYKSPRDMARLMRLERAAELLRTTDKTVEEVSDECGFYTPNYFIGNFFHKYKQTPREYREENS
jgi:transcriptional regulator GlxA family with amidase domain